jgi:hypothetical protein
MQYRDARPSGLYLILRPGDNHFNEGFHKFSQPTARSGLFVARHGPVWDRWTRHGRPLYEIVACFITTAGVFIKVGLFS